jgi:hypothetical protein
VGGERSRLSGEAKRGEGRVELSGQRRQRRRRLETDPHDARASRRREGAEAAHGELEGRRAFGNRPEGRRDGIDACLVDLAEELQRDVQVRFGDPRDVARDVAQAADLDGQTPAEGVGKENRDEGPEAAYRGVSSKRISRAIASRRAVSGSSACAAFKSCRAPA